LGFAPPSNAYLTKADLSKPEKYYPLRIKVCNTCWLVQTEDYAQTVELFNSDYAYFSSTSTGWLAHAEQYAQNMIKDLGLKSNNLVIEIASNDGYLLKNFLASGIPCLGIEPTDSTASAAADQGIPVLREFFSHSLGIKLAALGQQADLIAGNNVYAHVPDINDFTRGLKAILKPDGIITLEFPHLMSLIKQAQFDTVYHEHFSYLSLYTSNKIFSALGLRIWHVEKLPTHGGSLRIYGCHEDNFRQTNDSVDIIIKEEIASGLQDLQTYLNFQMRADKIKNDLIAFLIQLKNSGKKVVGYGAAAKGNTLLNYSGIKPDLLPFVCDAALSKQNKYMPGSHIPILHPCELFSYKPDYVLILPWNLYEEVLQLNTVLVENGVKFLTAVPELEVK
jgi:SAM-dependent methyltransferase